MFIRKKPNKSGTFTVQVVQKDRATRKNRVIKTIGTSSDSTELASMVREAQDYIDDQNGPMLPMDYDDPFETSLEEFLEGILNAQLQVIGPELIFGTLYDEIGYDRIADEMFRHLVICRLFNPGSKLKMVEYLWRYMNVVYDVGKIYKFMDDLCYRKDKDCKKDKDGNAIKPRGDDIRTQVEKLSFAHTKKVCGESITVVFYDMTTLYFEAAEEDELRKAGFSKDGKHSNPQILLGLLVAPGGNPIGYEIYEGNIHEGKTLLPLIEKLAEKHGFDHPIVVADAGLLSKKNIKELTEGGYEYILGARVKNETQAVKDEIIALNLKNGEVKAISKDKGVRLIVSMSDKRAEKDTIMRKKELMRLEKRYATGKLTKASINNRGYNKYLKMDGEVKVEIDMERFNADSVWDGIKGFVTNTTIKENEVLNSYSNLWFIERAFRMNKGDLMMRPIYHRLHNRIEAHVCICFTAYTIMLELERRLKAAKSSITIYQAGHLTKTMYRLNYQMPKSNRKMSVLLKMDDLQRELYEIVCKK